jgi:hypothetical protein
VEPGRECSRAEPASEVEGFSAHLSLPRPEGSCVVDRFLWDDGQHLLHALLRCYEPFNWQVGIDVCHIAVFEARVSYLSHVDGVAVLGGSRG